MLASLIVALAVAPTASAESPARQSVEGLVAGSFSAGSAHGCGIKPDGSAVCIGRNANGEAPSVVEGSFKQGGRSPSIRREVTGARAQRLTA